MKFDIEITDPRRRGQIKEWIGNTFIFQMQRTIVIDRERDIIFVSLGGQGDMPRDRGECASFYCLLWQKKAIYFHGYWKGEAIPEGHRKVLEVDGIRVPMALGPQIDEIKSTIDVVLAEYFGYLSGIPIAVRAHLMGTPSFYDHRVIK